MLTTPVSIVKGNCMYYCPKTECYYPSFVLPSYAVRVHSKRGRAAKVVHHSRQNKLYWAPSPRESIAEINSKGYMMR